MGTPYRSYLTCHAIPRLGNVTLLVCIDKGRAAPLQVKSLKSKESDPVYSQAGIAIVGGDPSSRVDRRWREVPDLLSLRDLGLL